MNSRHLIAIGLLVVLIIGSARAELVLGRDYAVLPSPQPTSDATKIEVLEFFSYACHSCDALQPYFAKWEAKAPKDVCVVRAPISLGHSQWQPSARAYYALEASGDLKRLDAPLFRALNRQRVPLFTDESVLQWVGAQGVDSKRFGAHLKSMSVDAKTKAAELLARRYQVLQTPTIIVNGKYLLLARAAKSYEDWPALIDELVALARAEQARKR